MTPVGRFAPTPSGRMHLGNVFSALLAWLSVRSRDGEMVLRMEDLDTQRTSAATPKSCTITASALAEAIARRVSRTPENSCSFTSVLTVTCTRT